jgi:hypothetical protein
MDGRFLAVPGMGYLNPNPFSVKEYFPHTLNDFLSFFGTNSFLRRTYFGMPFL